MSYSTCRSCGAKIHWIELKSGKKHPCDPEEVSANECEEGDKFVTDLGEIVVVGKSSKNESGYVSHFSTCPDADDWRKDKRRAAR
jgi:hypothetical protein